MSQSGNGKVEVKSQAWGRVHDAGAEEVIHVTMGVVAGPSCRLSNWDTGHHKDGLGC